jgi:hypothetical protein
VQNPLLSESFQRRYGIFAEAQPHLTACCSSREEIIRDWPIFQGSLVSGEEGRAQRTRDTLNLHVNKPA